MRGDYRHSYQNTEFRKPSPRMSIVAIEYIFPDTFKFVAALFVHMGGEEPVKDTAYGRGTDTFDRERVLDVLEARTDKAEPLTSQEIADTLGRSRSAAYRKCMSLVDDGVLQTKKTAARGRVFWIPLHTAPFQGDTTSKE